MSLYLIRHGQTKSNAEKLLTGRLLDYPLNDYGIKQVENLGRQIKNIHFELLRTSPLIRAKQTAEIIETFIKFDRSIIDERLIERNFGIFEGLNRIELAKRKNEFGILGGELTNYFPDGLGGTELDINAYNRVLGIIKEDAQYLDEGKNIAYFTHAGLIHSFLLTALGIPIDKINPFKIREASYFECIYSSPDNIQLLGLWNNTFF